MEYYLKPSAIKSLKRLARVIQKRIFSKLDFYIKTGNPLKFAETLKDKTLGDFRFRIEEFRVIFDVEKDKIIILKIGHRRDIHR